MSDNGLLTFWDRIRHGTNTSNWGLNQQRKSDRRTRNISPEEEARANRALLSGGGTRSERFAERDRRRLEEQRAQGNSSQSPQNSSSRTQDNEDEYDPNAVVYEPNDEDLNIPVDKEKPAIVYEIQDNLLEAGFDIGSDGSDGYYGRNTTNAVVEFQRKAGYEPTGVLTAEQKRVLEDMAYEQNRRRDEQRRQEALSQRESGGGLLN